MNFTPPPPTLDAPLTISDTMTAVVISEVCALAQAETARRTPKFGRHTGDNPAFRAASDQLAEAVWESVSQTVLWHVAHVLGEHDEATLAVVRMYVKAYARQSFQAARDIAAHENRLRVLDPLGTAVPPEQRAAIQQLQRRLARLLDRPEEA